MKKIDFWALGLLALGIVGMVILPFIVTQTAILNFFNVDFGKSNEIGDMIGGITGPFVALISAGLVYLTLREQIAMNDEFKKRFEKEDDEKKEDFVYNEIIANLKIINDLILNFKYHDYRGHDLEGLKAIDYLTRDIAFLYNDSNKQHTNYEFETKGWYTKLSSGIYSYLHILDRIYLYWKNGYDVIEDKTKLEILILELEQIRLNSLGLAPKLVLEFINLPQVLKGKDEFKNREDLILHFVYAKIIKLEYKLNLKAHPLGKSRNGTDFKVVYKYLPEIELFFKQNYNLEL
jgi:hypothetical protein